MKFLLSLLTWWNGQTLGTRLFTSRHGEKVGEDAEGNIFYQKDGGKRRWVIFNGETEASKVSPEWHGWLHFTVDEPPSKAAPQRKVWEKDHVPNMTGTPAAYHPPGSILNPTPAARADYEAWQPE